MQTRFERQFGAQWAILVLALLGLGALVAYTLYTSHRRTEAGEEARLRTQAGVIEQNLGKQLEGTDKVLSALRDDIAALPEHEKFTPAMNRRVDVLERAIPGIRTLFVSDAAGWGRLSSRRELIGRNIAGRDFFQRAREIQDPATLLVSMPYKTGLGVWGINLVRVISGPRGEFAGTVIATLDKEYFDTLLSSVRYAPDLRASIAHGDGTVFAMVPDEGLTGQNLARPGAFFMRHLESGQSVSAYSGITPMGAEKRMLVLHTLAPAVVKMEPPLVITVSRDLDAVFETWRRDLNTYIAILVLAAFGATFALTRFQHLQRLQLAQLQRADAELRTLNEQLEQRVRERTAELERANSDLTSFSYSIAHDLRAPVRALLGFSHILVSEHRQALDTEANDLVTRIDRNAKRIGGMVEDLLRLTRVGLGTLNLEPVDLDALVAEAIVPLAERYPQTAVATAPLPPAVCDRGFVREVLENLIGNAYKFSARVAAPRVEIGCSEEAAETVYFVRDNGVGFDMRYAAKLFNTFQRLHSVEEYPGLGSGLVLAKRMVERHGGRIWAQAEPGEGATLYFSLGVATRGA